ncbi:MAG: hypothetical protein WAU52_16625 [Burkholderiales bacterium]
MDTRLRPAQAYLACHAIELALSAYLSSQAVAPDQSGSHSTTRDLSSLLEQIESRGLVDLARLTPAQRRQIKKVTRYYSEAVFEYPALTEILRGHPDAPDIRTLLAAATALVAAAQKAVGVGIAPTRKPAKTP